MVILRALSAVAVALIALAILTVVFLQFKMGFVGVKAATPIVLLNWAVNSPLYWLFVLLVGGGLFWLFRHWVLTAHTGPK